jgi:hypothetical protein
MSVYLKQFETHAEYEAAKSSLILPNVSICKDTPNEVHYNPFVETRIVAKFNITDTSNPTKIASATTNFSSIEIDGVEQPSVTTGYTFSTTGEHTVKYTLKNPTSIGEDAFYNCGSLISITIPDSVTNIKNYAFYQCSGLTSITVPNSVTRIGNYTFRYCRSLTNITIPDSVRSIENEAFADCSGLTSVTIPNSVTSIGSYAFEGCANLISITVDANNTTYDSRGNCNAIITTNTNSLILGCKNTTMPNDIISINNGAFYGCSGLTSITIPNSVTSIGDNAFGACGKLTSITITSGVTSIGYQAFIGCRSLSSITSNAATAPTIQSYTFRGVKTGGTLYVPIGSSGYDTWMGTGDDYLGKYGWTKVEQ